MMSGNIRVETSPAPAADASPGNMPRDAADLFNELLISVLVAGAGADGERSNSDSASQDQTAPAKPPASQEEVLMEVPAFTFETVQPVLMPVPVPAVDIPDSAPPSDDSAALPATEGARTICAKAIPQSAPVFPADELPESAPKAAVASGRPVAITASLDVSGAGAAPQSDVVTQDAPVQKADAFVSAGAVASGRPVATTAPADVSGAAPRSDVITQDMPARKADVFVSIGTTQDPQPVKTASPGDSSVPVAPAQKVEPVQQGPPFTLTQIAAPKVAAQSPVETSAPAQTESPADVQPAAGEKRVEAKTAPLSSDKPSSSSLPSRASRADENVQNPSSTGPLNSKSDANPVRTVIPATAPAAGAVADMVRQEAVNLLAGKESDSRKDGSRNNSGRVSGPFVRVLDAAVNGRRSVGQAAEARAPVQTDSQPAAAKNASAQTSERAADPTGAPIGAPTADAPVPGVKVPFLSVQHSPLPNVQVLPGAAKMDSNIFSPDVIGRALAKAERLQTLVENMDRYILSAASSRDKSMTVTLIPENMGKVVLNCREDNGRIWVELQASNPAARDLLMRNEETIRNLMDQAGYKLAQFDVRGETANENRGFFQKQQDQYREESDARPEPEPLVNPHLAKRGAGAPISARQRGIWVVA